MPVILDNEGSSRWLDQGDPETLQELLEPCPPDLLHAYPVSPAVNDSSNDSPELIEEHRDPQTGLDDFS